MKNNQKIHKEELKIAEKYLEICTKYNLEYYILGGTLLGAVRHQGFIPWDDDMDFGMPREDYEKFLKIITSKKNIFKVTHFSLKHTHDYQIKLQVEGIKVLQDGKEIHPWIDILPLDGMPNNSILRKFHSMKLLSLRALYKISHMTDNVANFNPYRTKLEKNIINIAKILKLESIINEEFILSKLDRNLKKYSYYEKENIINFMGAYKLKEMFPRKIYDDKKFYNFENLQLKGPVNYDLVLTQLYGDYMTPPKKENQNKHNTKVINTFDEGIK